MIYVFFFIVTLQEVILKNDTSEENDKDDITSTRYVIKEPHTQKGDAKGTIITEN